MADAPSSGSALSAPSNSAPGASTAQSVLSAVYASLTPEAPEAAPGAAPSQDDASAAELDALVATESAARKGLSWEKALTLVPPDVAKLMKNMQADYTRKTQEVSEQRREILREREAMLRTKIEGPAEIPEYDPYNESSIQARIEAEVAKRMRQMLEPMQQEAELMRAEENYNSFLATNPDFKTDTALRAEVQHLLESNSTLDLETAYWAAKGKQSKLAKARETDTAAARRAATREAAVTGTGASRRGVAPADPTKLDARQMTNEDILKAALAAHGR